MTNKERILAARFLEMASERFSCHGCNDVPKEYYIGWTMEERMELVRKYQIQNGEDPEEFDPTWVHLPDFALMSYFAHELRREGGEDDV